MNVKNILRQCRIRFVEDGKNTKRGCVSIKCPTCGLADPSEHGNVSLKNGYFTCWRNKDHAMSFRKLITRIAGPEAATSIIDNDAPPPEDFDAAVAQFLEDRPRAINTVPPIDWPTEARSIAHEGPTRPYWLYLKHERMVPARYIADVCLQHDLRCCFYGPHNGRILMPIHNWDDAMIAFTGRAIGNSQIRYKAWPYGPAAKQGLFGLPNAKLGGRRLVICEGPFDALNLNIYAPRDCAAVAVMSTNATPKQRNLLDQLADLYDEVVILLDAQAEAQAIALQSEILGHWPTLAMPEHRKDPGEMNGDEVIEVFTCDVSRF